MRNKTEWKILYQNSVSHADYKLTAMLNIFTYIVSLNPHKDAQGSWYHSSLFRGEA